jgi:hypothetical protein
MLLRFKDDSIDDTNSLVTLLQVGHSASMHGTGPVHGVLSNSGQRLVQCS